MKTRVLVILIVLALAAGAVWWLLPEPPSLGAAATEPTTTTAPEPLAPPPPDQPTGDSCSIDCGDGAPVSILCAAGETPRCDCQATLKAQCLPTASP